MLRDMTSLVTPKFLVVRFPKGGKTTVAYELAWSLEAVLVDFNWEPPGGLGIVGGGRDGGRPPRSGRSCPRSSNIGPFAQVKPRLGPAVLAEA
jgi:hypothetical protein